MRITEFPAGRTWAVKLVSLIVISGSKAGVGVAVGTVVAVGLGDGVAVGTVVAVAVAVERIVGVANAAVDGVWVGVSEAQPMIAVSINNIVGIALIEFTYSMLMEAQRVFQYLRYRSGRM